MTLNTKVEFDQGLFRFFGTDQWASVIAFLPVQIQNMPLLNLGRFVLCKEPYWYKAETEQFFLWMRMGPTKRSTMYVV